MLNHINYDIDIPHKAIEFTKWSVYNLAISSAQGPRASGGLTNEAESQGDSSAKGHEAKKAKTQRQGWKITCYISISYDINYYQG